LRRDATVAEDGRDLLDLGSMTGKTDFTAEEWELVLEAAPERAALAEIAAALGSEQ
jgi:hypothetical protein